MSHLDEMLDDMSSAFLDKESIPYFKDCPYYVNEFYLSGGGQHNRNAMKNKVCFDEENFVLEEILYDPQTSGGLLASVASDDLENILNDFNQAGLACYVIGKIVEKDQFDFGDRLLLNFGHTYAHAIEQYYHYEKYSHGEAVGIGMYLITKLAESLDLTKTGSSMQIKEILQKYNLPYECQVETKNLIQAISLDKKNINNSLSVVLLKEIGDSYVYQTNQEFLLKKERV